MEEKSWRGAIADIGGALMAMAGVLVASQDQLVLGIGMAAVGLIAVVWGKVPRRPDGSLALGEDAKEVVH